MDVYVYTYRPQRSSHQTTKDYFGGAKRDDIFQYSYFLEMIIHPLIIIYLLTLQHWNWKQK